MSRLRTIRIWFLSSLIAAIFAVMTLTGWLLWPALHQYLTVRTLIERLKVAILEDDDDACYDARYELTKIGLPAVPALLDLAQHSDPRFRAQAIRAFVFMEQDGVQTAFPTIFAALKDENANVRMHACFVLGDRGSALGSTVPALTDALNDEDATVRRAAAKAVYEAINHSYFPRSRSAIEALRELLHDPDREVRIQAVESLHWLHEISDVEAARVLIEVQQGASEWVRQDAWAVLNALDPDAINEARMQSAGGH